MRPARRFVSLLLLLAPPLAAQVKHHLPPGELYDSARALAERGASDSALASLERLATTGAVAAFGADTDRAFASLASMPRFESLLRKIACARRPISHSQPAFELPERDLIPEGTAWDSTTHTLFLSSFYKRKIVSVAADGTARDLIRPGQDGIGAVGGLEVDAPRRTIWAAVGYVREFPIPRSDTTLTDAGAVFAYDVDTGKLRRRYLLPPEQGGRHGFNDLTVMPDGAVYVTDSQSGAVYRIAVGADTLTEALPPGTFVFPNGITRSENGRRLFIAHEDGIDMMDVASGSRVALASPDSLEIGGIDGLAYFKGSLIAHQPTQYRRVFRIYLDQAEHRVVRSEIIERHHPRFAGPTTGEVAGNTYYYIANAQLRRFRDGRIFHWSELDPVLILRTTLHQGPSRPPPMSRLPNR